jgi:hypothetical protein
LPGPGIGLGILGDVDDGVEGELGGGADQILDLLRASHAGHLDEDAVGALADDVRLAGADLVDAAAHDLERLGDGAGIGRRTLGLGQLDRQEVAAGRHLDVRSAAAGEARHGLGQAAHDLEGARARPRGSRCGCGAGTDRPPRRG